MPVKLKCPKCQKVLNAPDSVRGKAVKCPQCEARIRVPGEGAGSAPRRKKVPKRKKTAPAPQYDDFDDNLLGSIDTRRVEDRNVLICIKCATQIFDEEAIECPECGVNLETGVLSDTQRKLRERKGPDPAQFYNKVWGDCWQFIKAQWALCIRTGLIWAVCLTFAAVASQTLEWCVVREIESRTAEYEENKRNATENNPIAEKSPAQIVKEARTSPPALFWGFVSALFSLAYIGWYWFLASQVVTHTMVPRHKLKRVQFDLFSCVAWGIKGYIWPGVLILPFFYTGIIVLLPLFVFPLAIIHQTQRHGYKAYLPTEMIRIFFRMPAPVLYWMVIGVVVHVIPLAVLITAGIMFRRVLGEFLKGVDQLGAWLNSNTFGMGEGFFKYLLIEVPSMTLILLAVLVPWCLMTAFPSLFMMRATGLLGRYFRPELELVKEKKRGEPAGFWVRWLAFLIDAAIIGAFLLVLALILQFFISLGVNIAVNQAQGAVGLFGLVFAMLYFMKSESGLGKATLGKRTLGIVVTNTQGEQISSKTASLRFFGKIISALPLLIGFFLAASGNKQALHDRIAKTFVVFKGDDETTA